MGEIFWLRFYIFSQNSYYLSREMSEEPSFTTVYIANGPAEAHIIKGRLETEGIPAIFRYESAGLVYGITIDGLGQVEVQVPSPLAENARQILNSQEDGDISLSD
jgi:hypothetical protein